MIDHHDRTAHAPAAAAAWRRWLALAAAGVMLLMVTKGPVYWVRLEAADLSGDFIDDVWVQAAFVAGAAAVIVLAWPGRLVLMRDRTLLVVFAVFVALVALSTLWSVTPSRTIEQGTMLALGTAAGLLAGAWLGRLPVLVALWAAMQGGVLVSAWSDVRDWPRSIDKNGDLAGIYFNRNSLGPVALLGAAASTALLLVLLRRGSGRRRVTLAAGVGVAGVVDLAVWWRSGSLTPLFGVAVAAIAVVLLALFLPGPRAGPRRRVAVVLGACVATATVAGIAGRTLLTDRLDRSATFSGRTTIWDVVADYADERPLQGWGFMAAWRQPGIVEALEARGRVGIFEAHSGYMEVWLGIGIVGLIALLSVIAVSAQRTGLAAWRRPGVLAMWSFALVAYAVGVNVGETYVGANLLPWVLLAVAAGQAVAALDNIGAAEEVDASGESGLHDAPTASVRTGAMSETVAVEGAHG